MYRTLAGSTSVHQLSRLSLRPRVPAPRSSPAAAPRAPLKRFMATASSEAQPAAAAATEAAGACMLVLKPAQRGSASAPQTCVFAAPSAVRARSEACGVHRAARLCRVHWPDGPLYDSLDIRVGRINKARGGAAVAAAHAALRGLRRARGCVALSDRGRDARQAWKHPEAEKLFVEEVDVGEAEPRQARSAGSVSSARRRRPVISAFLLTRCYTAPSRAPADLLWSGGLRARGGAAGAVAAQRRG